MQRGSNGPTVRRDACDGLTKRRRAADGELWARMLLARAVTDLLGVTTRIHWGRHIFPRTNPVHPRSSMTHLLTLFRHQNVK